MGAPFSTDSSGFDDVYDERRWWISGRSHLGPSQQQRSLSSRYPVNGLSALPATNLCGDRAPLGDLAAAIRLTRLHSAPRRMGRSKNMGDRLFQAQT